MKNKLKTLAVACLLSIGINQNIKSQAQDTTISNKTAGKTIVNTITPDFVGTYYSNLYFNGMGHITGFSRPEIKNKIANRIVPKSLTVWQSLSKHSDQQVVKNAPWIDLTHNTEYTAPENATALQKVAERVIPVSHTTRLDTYGKDLYFMPAWNTSINTNRITKAFFPQTIQPWITPKGEINIAQANWQPTQILDEKVQTRKISTLIPDVDIFFNTQNIEKPSIDEIDLSFNTYKLKSQGNGKLSKLAKTVCPDQVQYFVTPKGKTVGGGLVYFIK